MKKIVHVVSHSHWDREWYFSLEDSNILLGENLCYLIDILENDYTFISYTFDGQSSVVDEFLSIYPNYKDRLVALVKAKRLIIGPWYTQCDTLLTHKESIIRNLFYGIKTARNFGGSMMIGYLPDVFGQNAYLPAIFKQFGIDYAVLQRGIWNDSLQDGLNVHWQSPNKAMVLANNIYLGYGAGKFLSSSDSYIEQTLKPMLDKLSSFNQYDKHLLLPAGGDQVLVRSHFPSTISIINSKLTDYELRLSSYEDFMIASSQNPTKTVNGQLRACQKSRIHRTIGSHRYDIKLLNTTWEDKMISILEPLNALAKLNNLSTIPSTVIDKMWKEAFDAHAHDSLGSCNSDETNANIIARLQKLHRTSDGYINIIQKRLAHAISPSNEILLLTSTSVKPWSGYVEATIFSQKDFEINYNNSPILMQILSKTYISGGKKIVLTASGESEVEIEGYYQYSILAWASFDGLGYQAWQIKPLDQNHVLPSKTSGLATIENEFYTISHTNNTVSLQLKNSNEIFNDFLKFEYTHDAGDSYDYGYVDKDAIYSKNIELIDLKQGSLQSHLLLKYSISVPKTINIKELVGLEVETLIILRKNEDMIRFEHNIVNNVKDFRLRSILSIPNATLSYAEEGFSLLEHSISEQRLVNWRENNYAEAPVPIYNFERLLACQSQDFNLLLCSSGLKEYELQSDGLALTLFRSIGVLGQDNLAWRPGRASGINNKVVATPDGYMHGDLNFKYSIKLTHNTNIIEQAYDFKNRYLLPVQTYHRQELNSFYHRLDRFELSLPTFNLPSYCNFLEIDNATIELSSLFLDRDSLIVRLFNPTSSNQEFNIKINFKYKECCTVNLLHEKVGEYYSSYRIVSADFISIKFSI